MEVESLREALEVESLREAREVESLREAVEVPLWRYEYGGSSGDSAVEVWV